MAKEVFKDGNRIAKDVVRVHRNGNRIDGVSKDNEMFFTDLPIPNRSKFDLSFDRKMSFRMGGLYPILTQECVPGDTFHIAQGQNVMFAPLIAPMFQRVDYKTWYFFVPTRLVDDGWKDYITGKTPDYVLPYFTCKQVADSLNPTYKKRFLDYLDVPIDSSNFGSNERHLLCHVPRMYRLIWNEYFRDEFNQTELTVQKTGGAITSTELSSMVLRTIGWEKDYFTTCTTSPQVGSDVPLPVGLTKDGTFKLDAGYLEGQSWLSTDKFSPGNTSGTSKDDVVVRDIDGTWKGTSSYASGIKTTGTINDLRIATHLQEYRDKLKIGGQRYNEAILAEFGVVVPDYRIQRPEYIGGYSCPVNISRVMQTTPVEDVSPLGSYAGSAVQSGRMDYIHYNALEHGYIIGLCAVMPRSGYSQGIPRQFMKDDIYSYYHPDFATLGDQAVYNDEIFLRDTTSGKGRFGYNQRYLEYKLNNDKINGEFRDSLSFWHMNRLFGSAPVLDSTFISGDPTTRIFAVEDTGQDNLYAEIYQEIQAIRPMPKSVQPSLTSVV